MRTLAAGGLAPVAAISALALAIAAPPAAAVVTPVAAPQFGIEPHSVTPLSKEPKLPLTYHGGPVMHSTATYAIYWDPTRSVSWNYDGDWKHTIDEYFQAVGQDSGGLGNVFAVESQYIDSGNGRAAYSSVFHGAYTDTSAYPSTGNCTDPHPEPEKFACLTDTQLRAELNRFVTANKLPGGLGTMYFLLTPPGVTVCTDLGGVTGHCSDSAKEDPWAPEAAIPSVQEAVEQESYEHSFCSYHAYTGSQSDPIVYSVEPWTAGNLAMFLPFTETRGTVLGSDCQDGTEAQQEPNQLPPPGLDTDGDFDAGLADIVINELSVEQIATETDPLLNGWYAPAGQANEGNEVTDQCRNRFHTPEMTGEPTPPSGSETGAGTWANQSIGGHPYYLNLAYSQAALAMDYPGVPCLQGVSLQPKFTAPNVVNAGEIVGFDAAESNISLDSGTHFTAGSAHQSFPTYIWDFGDGAKTVSTDPPGASQADEPSAFHSYAYGGTYTVTLTVTDVGGNTAATYEQVNVIGPPPPAPPHSQPGAGAGTGTSGAPATSAPSGNATSSSKGAAKREMPAPSVSERIDSHSLPTVLHKGLAIHYAVNEQVAGNVEVMIATSTAKRLRIHGAPAKHLPKGSQRQTVIGSAVLVTTRRGHGTLTIKLAHPIAKALEVMSRLKVTLRIVVRNASRQHPKTRTLISSFDLKG